MENLYEKLESVRQKNRKEVLDIAAPYQKTTLTLLKYVLSMVCDGIEDKLNNGYYFLQNYDNMEINHEFKISSGKEEDAYYVSPKYFKNMHSLITNFIENYGLGYAHYKGKTLEITLRCDMDSLKKALNAYDGFINGSEDKKEREKVHREISKFPGAQTKYEDTVADDLFYGLYQKDFLNQIKKVIDTTIDSTDHSSFMEDRNSRNIYSIIKCTTYGKPKNANSNSMYVPVQYAGTLSDMVDSFVHSYDLGYVNGRSSDTDVFYVCLNCSLDQLMNAYYMELQRLEYSLPQKEEQLKLDLTPNNN